MGRTLIGVCSFGGLRFLKLGVEALKKEERYGCPGPYGFDILVIVAKPGDVEMVDYLEGEHVPHLIHEQNVGFAAAINDMYSFAFVDGDYDNLIVMGNDVIPMPNAIRSMIKCARETHYEMVCGSEFDVRFLNERYPEVRQHFEGASLIPKQSAFDNRVWELHKDFRQGVEPDTRKDIRNLTLFKRSSFEKVGYADVNFWPNGYYEDNDYGRRCDLMGVSACGLKEAAFFHWWSRTKNEGENRPHDTYFERNRNFYIGKWGGNPGSETKNLPFAGNSMTMGYLFPTTEGMKISSRSHEELSINHWANL